MLVASRCEGTVCTVLQYPVGGGTVFRPTEIGGGGCHRSARQSRGCRTSNRRSKRDGPPAAGLIAADRLHAYLVGGIFLKTGQKVGGGCHVRRRGNPISGTCFQLDIVTVATARPRERSCECGDIGNGCVGRREAVALLFDQHILEIGNVILCENHQLIVAGLKGSRKSKCGRATGVRKDGGDIFGGALLQSHVGVGYCLNGEGGAADRQGSVCGDCHRVWNAQENAHRRISEAVVNLPVVLLVGAGGRRGFHRQVAPLQNASDSGDPVVIAHLAFCVEKLVVHAQVGCAEGRIGGDVTANTHSPVVILVPIGFLGGTDIAHGSFVGSSQECLGKAFALLETS